MPEYPEVTTVTNTLNKIIPGSKVITVEVLKDKLIKNTTVEHFKEIFEDTTITKIENIGKYIVFYLDTEIRVISHLRMSGKYFIYNYAQVKERRKNPLLHDYVFWYLNNDKVMIYNDARMFGAFDIIEKDDTRDLYTIKNLAHLPGEVDVDALYAKTQKKRVSIKKILLDQSLVLGIGNIYADETLHLAKIYPMTKCNLISKEQLKELLNIAQKIMDKSIELGGSSVQTYTSVNGVVGSYQHYLNVYNRQGKTCRTCKRAEIVKVRLDNAPNGRGTSYCPNCQREVNE
ncbi:bifunctional DNA-formamidopyrimidine glycosylase/DNA-(apurinic or apyrimidinic site) lyase [Mycoplasma sp. Pen4]|uniref:bifunctional DNA-formamidopyrimidine glycosylase/DNA-(apurinic or apyrimidinic site) lyase n=1 Tax=Mycoplasma sp. Pen4 TaxID=640330 RepID=UPI0016548E1E|nr:bifunctional DNA-formamidopyrimidine glycosylase/DNA-(apurinic or apyrimidinic site) lyase [Mycoplasma sp. Pen4]QNM93488.1 bifunctional DNA-formamidopyrimidine glycosylase/DNA-(apurinic or apyrimidinic site) lyase [Mycoplasma sp. Pen4]